MGFEPFHWIEGGKYRGEKRSFSMEKYEKTPIRGRFRGWRSLAMGKFARVSTRDEVGFVLCIKGFFPWG
jgi:hypothetical protein